MFEPKRRDELVKSSMNGQIFDFPGPVVGELEESSSNLGNVPALRERVETEGYLLIRDLIPRAKVLEARRIVLESLHREGLLKPHTELMDGFVNPEAIGKGKGDAIAESLQQEEVRTVLDGEEVRAFFDGYFSEPTFVLDLKIIRVQRPGRSTGIHYDVVYMGRGTRRLCSCWIPLGDIAVEQGPVALCAGSNSLPGFAKLRETYGHYDVDRTLMRGVNGSFSGWFSFDLLEISERFGGRWRSANYRAGDILVFTPLTMHCGLDNNSDRYRLSSDIRCQPLSEPADPRWVGDGLGNTEAHQLARKEIEAESTLEEAREDWGV